MKVLIVDDSRVFRSIVKDTIDNIHSVEVVGSVWNGEKAIEFIQNNEVDLVTLDVEMPTMDGIETLYRLQKLLKSGEIQNLPTIIMLSSITDRGTEATIQALELGAFDFIPKNSKEFSDQSAYLKSEFNRVFSSISNNTNKRKVKHVVAGSSLVSEQPKRGQSKIEFIVLGVSTGGPKALTAMLPELSKRVQCPILIVQHMPPLFTESLANSLDRLCEHHVIEAKGDEEVVGRNIFIAPGGHHMAIRKAGTKIITSINEQPPEAGCRPSVDVLFRSASNCIGDRCLAIILTGMGVDGSAGIRPLKRAGASIIVQDEKTSVVWGMPGAAVETGLVDKIVPLLKIPSEVETLIKGGK